jgi:hypothetical protein
MMLHHRIKLILTGYAIVLVLQTRRHHIWRYFTRFQEDGFGEELAILHSFRPVHEPFQSQRQDVGVSFEQLGPVPHERIIITAECLLCHLFRHFVYHREGRFVFWYCDQDNLRQLGALCWKSIRMFSTRAALNVEDLVDLRQFASIIVVHDSFSFLRCVRR